MSKARDGRDDTAPPESPSRDDDGGRPARDLRVWFLVVGAVAVLVLGSPWWAPLLLRRLDFFRVRRVEIVGAHYLAASDILSRLNVDTTASVWNPTKPLAARVAAYSGIQTVVVSRKLPGTLVVEITERIPVALVQANGGLRPYDERGVLLPIDPARVPLDAPVLMQRDVALLRLLGKIRAGMPALYARVSSARRVGRDELVLQLKTGPVRAMIDVTLARLADIDPVEADLARRQVRVSEIDLRYRDQVIARIQ
jgi:cell division protein FtsQ